MIDISRVRQSHRKFLSEHDRALNQSLDESRTEGIGYVQREPGFTRRSGELQDATTGQITRTSRGSLVRLENRKPHAKPIDKGSRAHFIPMKAGGKVLRFRIGGSVYYRREVFHPGNKPYTFLRRATIHGGQTFERRMSYRMNSVARSF